MSSPVDPATGAGAGTGFAPGVIPGGSGVYASDGYGTDGGPASRHSEPAARAALGTDDPRSLGELISEITTDLSTLVQQEIALAKAETMLEQ